MDAECEIAVSDHVKDGKALLHLYLRKGTNEVKRDYLFTQASLIEGKFNVINLKEEYLNGEYELHIWSWNPGHWSKNYTIQDNILLVDTEGMTGFLLGVFEKGYEIENPNAWDTHILKQSGDIRGESLQAGFADMSDF